MSTVRAREKYLQHDEKFGLGFVDNARRFNTALTRVASLLVIVGSPRILWRDPVWRRFLEYVARHGGYEGPSLASLQQQRPGESAPVTEDADAFDSALEVGGERDSSGDDDDDGDDDDVEGPREPDAAQKRPAWTKALYEAEVAGSSGTPPTAKEPLYASLDAPVFMPLRAPPIFAPPSLDAPAMPPPTPSSMFGTVANGFLPHLPSPLLMASPVRSTLCHWQGGELVSCVNAQGRPPLCVRMVRVAPTLTELQIRVSLFGTFAQWSSRDGGRVYDVTIHVFDAKRSPEIVSEMGHNLSPPNAVSASLTLTLPRDVNAALAEVALSQHELVVSAPLLLHG